MARPVNLRNQQERWGWVWTEQPWCHSAGSGRCQADGRGRGAALVAVTVEPRNTASELKKKGKACWLLREMQGGKNWKLDFSQRDECEPVDSHWLEIWSKHFCPSMGPNGGRVAMDSGKSLRISGVAYMTPLTRKGCGCQMYPGDDTYLFSYVSCLKFGIGFRNDYI